VRAASPVMNDVSTWSLLCQLLQSFRLMRIRVMRLLEVIPGGGGMRKIFGHQNVIGIRIVERNSGECANSSRVLTFSNPFLRI
jgi:hypothetical protein